jgi:hypothetical protein
MVSRVRPGNPYLRLKIVSEFYDFRPTRSLKVYINKTRG